MPTTHIIIDNIVANTIVATVAEAQTAFPDAICLDAEQHPGGIGWAWDGTALHAPEQPAPEPAAVPAEVPRYCGVLALKRHRLADGELEALGDEEGWESGSLYAQLLAFRNGLPSGALRDKLDIAIDHVMHWTLESPTVAEMCAVMGLSTAQRDALFRWAKAHEATL